jgi:hypothetical protein
MKIRARITASPCLPVHGHTDPLPRLRALRQPRRAAPGRTAQGLPRRQLLYMAQPAHGPARPAPRLRHRPSRQRVVGARGERLAARHDRVGQQVGSGAHDKHGLSSNDESVRTSAAIHVRGDEAHSERRDAAPSAGARASGQVDRALRVRRRVHEHHAQAIRTDEPS